MPRTFNFEIFKRAKKRPITIPINIETTVNCRVISIASKKTPLFAINESKKCEKLGKMNNILSVQLVGYSGFVVMSSPK